MPVLVCGTSDRMSQESKKLEKGHFLKSLPPAQPLSSLLLSEKLRDITLGDMLCGSHTAMVWMSIIQPIIELPEGCSGQWTET